VYVVRELRSLWSAVFNVVGQEVSTPVDEVRPAGRYGVRWLETQVASGAYVYTLMTESYIQIRRMGMVK
jgi:hypothetical protein